MAFETISPGGLHPAENRYSLSHIGEVLRNPEEGGLRAVTAYETGFLGPSSSS